MECKSLEQAKRQEEIIENRGMVLTKGIAWAAIVGVDGSGKSTVLRRLQQREDELPCRGIEFLHRRPGAVYQSQKSAGGEITHYSKPNHGRFLSILKIAAMIVDWQVGYWTYIRRRWEEGYFVIADRHSLLDMLADPDRYRYGGHPGYVHLALKIAPIPPLIFLLDAPTQVLQARKQELNQTRLLHLRNSYLDIFSSWPGCTILDAARPVDVIVSDLVKAIAKGLNDSKPRHSSSWKSHYRS